MSLKVFRSKQEAQKVVFKASPGQVRLEGPLLVPHGLLSPTDWESLRAAVLGGESVAEEVVRLVTRQMTGDPADKAVALRALLPR